MGFLEFFLLELKCGYQVQWFKSPDNEREEFPLSQHLVEMSWNSTEESWDSTVLGQYSLGTVVLGQYQEALGQYRALGQYGLGTVVLGQSSSYSSLGTVPRGPVTLPSTLGTVPRSPGTIPESLGTV